MSKLKLCFVIIMVLLVIVISFFAFKPKEAKPLILTQDDVKTEEGIKKAAEVEDASLTTPAAKEIVEEIVKDKKPYATFDTVYEKVPKVARAAEKKEKSDFSVVVVPDKAKLEQKIPVELNQYHVYTSPKVLTEVGLKLDADAQKPVVGISCGRKWRVDKKGRYIGTRMEYDWKRKQAGVWLTYTY